MNFPPSPTGGLCFDSLAYVMDSMTYADQGQPRKTSLALSLASEAQPKPAQTATKSYITFDDLDYSGLERRLLARDAEALLTTIWNDTRVLPSPDFFYSKAWTAGRRVGKSTFRSSWWAYNNFPEILNPKPADEFRAAVLWAMEDLSRGR